MCKEAKKLRIPYSDGAGIIEKQALVFYQARNDLSSKLGNKGTIESLNKKPLNIIFESDEIIDSIIKGGSNFFIKGFVVDVSVENIQGKPCIYRIHKFHDSFDPEYGCLKINTISYG